MASRRKLIKKCCLLGSASDSKEDAPFEDETIEMWGLAWRMDLPRYDRMFDIHHTMGKPFKKRMERKKIGPHYIQQLSELNVPVCLQYPHPEVPNSYGFPLEESNAFLKKFDPDSENPEYYASTCAYMLINAMLEGYKEIHLYGIDLIDDEEYGHQRPNMEYLIGLARGIGIRLVIGDKSAMCRFPYRYGYDDEREDEGIITIKSLQDRVKMYTDTHQQSMCKAFTADGARQEAQHLMNILKGRKKGRVP